MSKLVKERIWIGTIATCLLAVLNIVSSSAWTIGKIISLMVFVIAVGTLVLALFRQKVAANLNKWGYELEFFIVLLAGLFTQSRFSTWQTVILVIAVILFLLSWLIKFRQETNSDAE